MEDKKQDILAKIRKLISKRDSAEKIGNQEEANAFTAKIVEMTTKYNIELHALEAESNETSGPSTTDTVIPRVQYERRHEGDWAATLLNTLAKYNFCLCYKYGDFDGYKNLTGVLVLVGEPHNIEVVKYLYEYLVEAGRRLGRESLKNYPDAKRNSYLRAFYTGFGIAIYKRLKDAEEANKTNAATQQYGLVLVSHEQKNLEYLKKQGINLGKAKAKVTTRKETRGLIDGRQAGNNINLNKQLQNKQSSSGLLN